MIPTQMFNSPGHKFGTSCVAFTVLLPALALLGHAAQPPSQSIFDGRTLAGWTGNSESWRVEDGAITGEIAAGTSLKQNEFLYWHGEVHDFELTAEFRISGGPGANSGIQFRSQRLANGHAAGYQADLDDGTTWLGRIYDEHGRALLVERGTRVSIAPDGRRWADPWAKPADFGPLFKPGEWNSYRIHASGSHIEVWINSVLVSVLDDLQREAADLSGLLALQMHSGPGPAKVQFRNIRLAQLGRTSPLPAPVRPAHVPSVAMVIDTNAAGPKIGDTRKNGDPPLRRVANIANSNRAETSPVLWHLQSNPAKSTAVANPAAQELIAGMRITNGFQAELIAAEPDVHQPIAMAIDERGRLWVAEAFGYPKRQPEGAGRDRIVIFEDTNGDGSFEKRTTFSEGLNLVSGLEVGFGGVWVGAAPHLLFIPDRNHDDKADGPPEVLLDGWGYQDTHETLNSFTWGPDGWLYGCHGVFTHSFVGKPGTPADQRTKIRAGVWRYHPVRHEFEVYAHGGSNQWGLDFNELGHLFMTHCRSRNGGGGTTFVIRNGHYWNQANADYAPFISNHGPGFAPDLKNFLPASARYDSGEGGAGKPGTTAVFGGHSHVGTMIYLGDNWPDTYRDHLFTHNLHGHQLNHQHNVRQGSGYETFHGGSDLLFVPDPSYMAVDLQYGPDGAVYVIDWSDLQHCHNPREELWDRTNGRIYRVSWAETYKPVAVNLAAKTDAELAALHTHRSEWFVRTARRLLQQRAATRKIDAPALDALRAQISKAPDAAAYLRALWTLHTVGALDKAALSSALNHPADVVRAWAVQLSTERPLNAVFEPAIYMRAALEDQSPTVRLALASALPALRPDWRWGIGAGLAQHASDATERFLPKMIWFGIAPQVADDFSRALDLAARTPLPALADSLLWFLARTPAGREAIIAQLGRASDSTAARGARVLAFALEGDASVAMPAGWPALATRLGKTSDPAASTAADQLSAVFGDQAVLTRMRGVLSDTSAPLPRRRTALALLRRVGDTAAMPIYIRLLEEDKLRSDAIPLLAGTDQPEAAAALIRHYPELSRVDRAAALGSLTGRPALALELLNAVSTHRFDRKELTSLHVRQLRNLRDSRVDRRLDEVLGGATESSPNVKATVARLKQAYTESPLGSATVGKQVFDRLCTACHRLDGDGGRLGPDLTGSWSNGLDYFLENIVDPNAVVGANFQLNLITKHDGAVISGMVERDTETGLVVRTVSETITLPKQQIKHREVIRQSLMPAGLLEAIPESETIALLKYLVKAR